jgi:hypothetical protein
MPGSASRNAFRLALLPLAGFFTPLFAQTSGSPTPDYPIHLRGTVVNAVTGEPIPHALVHSPDNRFATMANDEGQFEFTFPQVQMAPALMGPSTAPLGSPDTQAQAQLMPLNRPFALMARKPGYLEYFDGLEQVSVEPRQEEVSIALFPESRVISRVTSSGTDGIEKIQVALYRRMNQDGRERWEPIRGDVMTRSNGEFRFANLQPGSYKLFTRESMDRDALVFLPGDGPLFGFPPLYYPSASDFESAAVIHLSAGETLQTMLTPQRREYYRVRLPITNNPAAEQYQIEVWSQSHPGPGFSLGYDARQNMVGGSLPDGAYTVLLRSYSPIGMTGMSNFVVRGAAVSGPSLSLVPNVSVPVTVQEEMQHRPEFNMTSNTPNGETFTASARRPSYITAILVPADSFGSGQDVGLSPPTGPDDVTLRFDNVPPGRYRVRVIVNGGYASSVVSGSTDLQQNLLAVDGGSAPQPIEITVRDDGAEVRGHVDGLVDYTAQASTESQLVAISFAQRRRFRNRWGSRQPTVYFIPEARGSNTQLPRAFVGPGGEFETSQMPPGSYRVLAFEHQQDDLEFATEDQLRRYDSTAQRVELGPGDKQTLKLSVTPTEN